MQYNANNNDRGAGIIARVRKSKPPLVWTEVKNETEVVLGQYAIDGGMIIVRSAKGWEKTTQIGNLAARNGLARLILSEGPP